MDVTKRKTEQILFEWETTSINDKKIRLIEAVAPLRETMGRCEVEDLEGLDPDVQLVVLKEICEEYLIKIDSMQDSRSRQGKEVMGLKSKVERLERNIDEIGITIE
ncbi:hypothetical protein O9G_005942, partial [Rozella allomycis CSF55]